MIPFFICLLLPFHFAAWLGVVFLAIVGVINAASGNDQTKRFRIGYYRTLNRAWGGGGGRVQRDLHYSRTGRIYSGKCGVHLSSGYLVVAAAAMAVPVERCRCSGVTAINFARCAIHAGFGVEFLRNNSPYCNNWHR